MAADIYLHDAINLLYLYETTGEYGNQKICFADVKDYVEYIVKVRKIEQNSKDSGSQVVERALSDSIQHFLKNYKADRPLEVAQDNGNGRVRTMTVQNFYNALQKVLHHEKLSTEEVIFFLEKKNDVVNAENVWDFLGLDEHLLEETELPFNMTDVYFTQNYKIGRVFSINQSSEDSNLYKQSVCVTHGTSNENVLSILANGFISSSEVNTEQRGHVYGHGIYGAKPENISKTLGYMSKPSTSTPSYLFIIQMDFDNEEVVDASSGAQTINSGDLLHVKKAGYGLIARDEFIVPNGSQVRATHLVEVFEKN
jgi:hypothetical protein